MSAYDHGHGRDSSPAPRTSGKVDGKILRQAKRQRFHEKQARADKSTNSGSADWLQWINYNSSFAQLATAETIESLRIDPESPLYPYFDLQERPSCCGSNGPEKLFIAEGTETIRLLLQQLKRKDYQSMDTVQVKSIFVKPSVMFESPVNLRAEIERIQEELGNVPFEVIVADSSATQSKVAGFEISRGAIACGVVPEVRDWAWLLLYFQRFKSRNGSSDSSATPLHLVALDGVSDTANLGSIIRTAAAFGIHAILLSSSCCDAWYRRTVRVSMGHVFNIPCIRVDDLPSAIQHLARSPFQITSYAAVVQKETDLVLERLGKGKVDSSWLAVFGCEGTGITGQVLAACDRTIRIDINDEVDSLSLPIAAGILLHGLRERSQGQEMHLGAPIRKSQF